MRFDGTDWTVYRTANSGLPENFAGSIAIDKQGNKWIASAGLVKFDGTGWTVLTSSNSGLPENAIYSIAIDGRGNKWIGTRGGGLAVYHEGGTILVAREMENQGGNHNFILEQNYPNPFNPSTTIHYALPKRSKVTLTVFNLLGQEVVKLADGEKEAGYHEVQFDGSHLTSGVYLYSLQARNFVQMKKFVILK